MDSKAAAVKPKLKRLPKNARIQKRPLLRPPISSPYTNAEQPKIIYVSCTTPFVSAVKRARKLLSLIDKRAVGKAALVGGKGSDRQRLRAISQHQQGKEAEEVIFKATGRAIEKALGLALFFQKQEDCRVRLRTGSVGVVDDIVEIEGTDRGGQATEPRAEKKAAGARHDDGMQAGEEDRAMAEADAELEEELPETQIRTASFIEVRVSLK